MKRPETAFILAAGRGTRLKPLTDHCPKPLVPVGGKAILDYTLEAAVKAGIKRILINGHYEANLLAAHVNAYQDSRLDIDFIYEEDLYETGGSVRLALDAIGEDPFYLINGDALWRDSEDNVFDRLWRAWDPEIMDILLLLYRHHSKHLPADYVLGEGGQCLRSHELEGTHAFTGVRLTTKAVVKAIEKEAFSYLECMDAAEQAGRLYGLEHQGAWYHISVPEDVAATEDALKNG